MCLVSVIIPVYNVEKYLDMCISSVVKQTYTNLEIILIDDGSTDYSGQICDEWANKDSRIIVVHKNNGGLSDARNIGLDKAKGNWIVFVDSDDTISLDMISITMNVAKKNKVDMVAFGIKRVDEGYNENSFDGESVKPELLTGKTILYEFAKTGKGYSIVCNKLYKKETWKNLRFPLGKIHEDEFVIVQILQRIRNIAIIDNVLYFYRQREGSIMASADKKSEYDALEAFELRCREFRCDPELYQWALRLYLDQLMKIYYIENRENQITLLREFRHYAPFRLNRTTLKTKIRYWLFCLSPQICKMIVQIRCNLCQ